jgi:RND family efflux transporter MFP subunit
MNKINYLFIFFLISLNAIAQSFEGFTEPDLEIKIAAPENGVLATMQVKEGQKVEKNQALATLDNRVLEASLIIAKAKQSLSGKINSASATQRLHQSRLERLKPLLEQGAAQQTEIDQTRAELEVAKANVQTAKEEQHINSLEVKQIEAQIERRILRSPIEGIVTEIHKKMGESVTGGTTANDQHVLTLVRVNPLIVTIHVPTAVAMNISIDQKAQIQFPDYSVEPASGQVFFVSPITNAGSDTVKIKIRLINQDIKLRSGMKCVVNLQPKS